MKEIQLAQVDLNLLVVLRELLATGSVKEAAVRVGRTASAVSHALRRLRETFGEPLFVRDGQRLVPTAFARGLAEPLERVLGEVSLLLERRANFNPRELVRTFSVGTTDYAQLVVLPRLLERLGHEAPGVTVTCVTPGNTVDALVRERSLDVALGSNFQPLPGLVVQKLYDERLVAVARRGTGPLDLETYLERKHVLVTPRGMPGSLVDTELERRGLRRQVVLRTPHFLVALHLVATSDLVTTVPARVVEVTAAQLPLEQHPLPVDLEPLLVGLLYSEVYRYAPAQIWFRGLVGEVCLQR